MAVVDTAGLSLDEAREAPRDDTAFASGPAHVAWMVERARGEAKDERQSLLLLRFALLNVIGFALCGVAWVSGLAERALVADQTRLSLVILAVFAAGLIICTRRVWQTSRDLDQLRAFDPLVASRAAEYIAKLRGVEGEGRGLLASSLRLKLTQRIAVVRHIANSLVVLGLIGTVIGFVIALSGIDPAEAGDVKAIAPMVSTMIEGMSTALYTTLIGAVLNLWLLTNYQLLATGTVKLITALVEFGEVHGRT